MITYTVSEEHVRATVSGVELSRDIKCIFGGSDGIRTMIFSTIIRSVRQGSFHGVKSLKSVVLNEGLERLGTEEYKPDGEMYSGAFQESGLERVRFPFTLKKIEDKAFLRC